MRRFKLQTAWAAVLALFGGLCFAPQRLPADSIPPRGAGACPLCRADPGVPIRMLTDSDIDSLGASLARGNERALVRCDSLYQAGRFGAPGSRDARRGAQLFARLVTRNAYSYVADLATDSTQIREADSQALERAFVTYSDPGLYPITRLRRVRMGFGHLCLQYDLRGSLDTLTTLGSRKVRVRIRDVEVDGDRRRMLSMMLPTGLDDVVEVLLPAHYSCRVDHLFTPDAEGSWEAVVLDEIHGLYLRKWGMHGPRAVMFWTTLDAMHLDALPAEPRLGVRIYVPDLRLDLPFLPDVGFDDLREMDLPQPVMRLGALPTPAPDWLEVRAAGFDGWTGFGPVPAGLRARFPDH